MTSGKKLQVPWLPAPVWKDFEIWKGLGHHRNPVGIILAANKKLECILESDSLDQVRVRLLNDDCKKEGNFLIVSSEPGRAGTFSVDSVSVPFLDCEYLKEEPEDNRTINISFPSDSKILPIYRFGDNEDDFFKLWDNQDAEFAYIESDYISILIPKIDKEAARKLPDGKHLDDVIVFHDKILTTYSELIGMSFEETGLNQNVRNRFFLKADINGIGAAYCSKEWAAETSASIKSFWLDINTSNWGALHEFGHGHEIYTLSDESLNVIETWNNVLAFFYQAINFGKDMVTKGSKQKDMVIAEFLRSGEYVKNWGYIGKLSFLVHMFFKAGKKSFARFNQLTRQELDGGSYYGSGTTLVEKLMHFFAIDFSIDVYPFMRLAKAPIEKAQVFEHYYVLCNVAYPLNYLISDTMELNTVQNNLGLLFETSLVTPLDLSSTKLKNDFTLKIGEELFRDLSGHMLKLMDGSRTVVERKIEHQTILLKDIPIGVYKVFVEPNSSNVKFIYDDFYAVVHASKPSELIISAKVMKKPTLTPYKINFLGLGDLLFAYLSADPFNQLLQFKVFRDKPHEIYRSNMYAKIIVRNKENIVIFTRTLGGDNSFVESQEIKMEAELEVEIFHAETKNRLKTDDSTMDSIIDINSNTNYFLISEQGFKNKNKQTTESLFKKNFLKKIEFKASKIRSKISLYARPYCLPKYNLLLAVEVFERLFENNIVSKQLRDQYKDCLPPVTDDKQYK